MSFTIRTAEEVAAKAAAVRAQSLKADCRTRIISVASETAQANITRAGARYAALRTDGSEQADAMDAVGFVEGDMQRIADLTGWISDMQAACRTAISTGDDPIWPDEPESAADFVARF